jgi:hypothetical protein
MVRWRHVWAPHWLLSIVDGVTLGVVAHVGSGAAANRLVRA